MPTRLLCPYCQVEVKIPWTIENFGKTKAFGICMEHGAVEPTVEEIEESEAKEGE
jgi:hypothetical protein